MSTTNHYDVCIVGAGVAGVFAALKIAKENKNTKTILLDLGARPGKRKRQIEGWFGAFPSGDGKLYLTDVPNVAKLTGIKKANSAHKWFNDYVSDTFDMKLLKDPGPKVNLEKRIRKLGFDVVKNNHLQVYPKEIHLLSRKIVNDIEKYINLSFDNEVLNITKTRNKFTISCVSGDITATKLIICSGRSGWRWTRDIYDSFGIIKSNDIARFGIRAEVSSSVMRDFNKSSCTISNDDIEIGPLSWNGTIIQEDHIDFAISAFRSNEVRWKSDKVSFNIIGNRKFENNGFEQMNRISQLTFILSNDRVLKERISHIVNNKSSVSIMPEYKWLKDTIEQVGAFMPELASKGYFHVPTVIPMAPTINISNAMETDIDGMYCAGESSGVQGILAAAVSGIVAANGVLR